MICKIFDLYFLFNLLFICQKNAEMLYEKKKEEKVIIN